ALARRTPWAYTVKGARGRGRPHTDRRWTGRRAWSRTAPNDRDERATGFWRWVLGLRTSGNRQTTRTGPAGDSRPETGGADGPRPSRRGRRERPTRLDFQPHRRRRRGVSARAPGSTATSVVRRVRPRRRGAVSEHPSRVRAAVHNAMGL